MPIALTPLGLTLDVAVIDGNMKELQDFFRESMQTADFTGRYTRFRISRYASGRLIAHHAFANPWRSKKQGRTGVLERLDINYRAGSENAGDPAACYAREEEANRAAYTMELLGFPGPSFYFDFQEDNIAEPAGVAGWPVSGWPYKRFPSDACYSHWMTVPGAACKVFVPQRCTAYVKGQARGSLTPWRDVRQHFASPKGSDNTRGNSWAKFGLIVDTNPNIYVNEFANTNQHILNPNGTMASWKSWKVIQSEVATQAQREKYSMWGALPLNGGHTYNFRLAVRAPGHFGWVDKDANAWVSKYWENCWNSHFGVSNAPQIHTAYKGVGPFPYADSTLPSRRWICPPWLNLWESGAIDIEFHYGRASENLYDTDNAEFDTIYSMV